MGFRVYDSSPKYIYQTQFGYCFRFVIPSDLRQVISKKEIRYSLKTRDQSKAKALSKRLAGFIQEFCSNVRRLIGPSQKSIPLPCSPDNINDLITAYFRSVIDGDFKSSLKAEILAAQLFDPGLQKIASEYATVFPPEPGPTKTSGNAEEKSNNEAPQNHPVEQQSTPSLRLSEIIALYMDEQIRAGNWTQKTQQEYESACGLLKEIIGDLPIDDISHQEIQKFKQTLLKLPSHMKTSPKYKGKTIKQLSAMEVEKTMSIANVNKLLTRSSSLFSYAVRNGYMPSNPAQGMQIKQSKRTDELRSIFNRDDLEKLILSEEYLEGTHPQPFCFWMPLLGMYTGCRLEELAQLHTEDIRKIDGIWVIDINNTGDKKIKTKSAIRLIPLHPFLTKELHLPKFVESLRKKGEARVFPELPKRRDGFGVKASRWFNERYKVKCGITIGPGEKKDFHSFRHTFADNLKQKQVDPYMISELLGHSVDSITMGRYGKRYGIRTLMKKAIVQIDYGINLSIFNSPLY